MTRGGLIALLCWAITGCSTIFTNVNELSPGAYSITASGNVFNTREGLIEKIDAKAAKLCGENGFEYQGEGTFSVPTHKAYVNERWIDVHSTRLIREVICN